MAAADRNGSDSRRIAVAPPASDGRFVFQNLPPGTYFLAAIGDLEPGSLFDPEFLEAVAAAAVSVTIAPGGRTQQDLRVAR